MYEGAVTSLPETGGKNIQHKFTISTFNVSKYMTILKGCD
jgi:hypothetical protein